MTLDRSAHIRWLLFEPHTLLRFSVTLLKTYALLPFSVQLRIAAARLNVKLCVMLARRMRFVECRALINREAECLELHCEGSKVAAALWIADEIRQLLLTTRRVCALQEKIDRDLLIGRESGEKITGRWRNSQHVASKLLQLPLFRG